MLTAPVIRLQSKLSEWKETLEELDPIDLMDEAGAWGRETACQGRHVDGLGME